jgi:hypothetical protein
MCAVPDRRTKRCLMKNFKVVGLGLAYDQWLRRWTLKRVRLLDYMAGKSGSCTQSLGRCMPIGQWAPEALPRSSPPVEIGGRPRLLSEPYEPSPRQWRPMSAVEIARPWSQVSGGSTEVSKSLWISRIARGPFPSASVRSSHEIPLQPDSSGYVVAGCDAWGKFLPSRNSPLAGG